MKRNTADYWYIRSFSTKITICIAGIYRKQIKAVKCCIPLCFFVVSRIPAGSLVADGYVAPPSYCRIEKGMAMFHDAHQYFSMVSKGVESYLEMAVDLDDVEFLTDNELFLQACRIVRERYGAGSLKEISKNQRMELAKMMKHEYRSSNSQICRVLNLTQFEVDSIFPLSATHGR